MKTEEFKRTLDVVLSGVAKKEVSEVMGQIVFDDGYLISYNDKIAVSSSFDCNIDNCGVNAKDLQKAIKGIRTKEFELSVKDDFLIIEGGKVRVELPTMIVSEMKNFHESINIDSAIDKMKRLPSNFIPGVILCIKSVSDNMSSSFGGYAMKFDKNTISATDGYRASIYELDKKLKTKSSFFLSKEIVNNVIDFSPEKIHITDNWIYFTNAQEDTVIACRTSIDNTEYFPNLEKLIVKGKRNLEFTITESDVNDLDMLSFFTEGDKDADKEIKMVIKKKKVILSGVSIKGSARVMLKTDYKGEKTSCRVSSVFIKDILDSMPNTTFQLNNSNLYIEEGNFQHLINLVG